MMDIHTATELAYKNGYARGFADTDEAKYAMLAVTHWMPLPEPPKGE